MPRRIEDLANHVSRRLHSTLERFCMDPFRVGTDRLPVYTMSWNYPVQNRSFKAFTHEKFQTTASISIHQEHEKFLKKFSTTHLFFEALHKVSFESKFSSYCQLPSVELPLASFLSVPDENGSGSLHGNFVVRFRAGPTF